MGVFEQRKQELLACAPETTMQEAAVNAYWNEQAEKQAAQPLNISRERAASPFSSVRVDKLTFAGVDNTPINCWLIWPESNNGEPLPCVVLFQGYCGDRGFAERYSAWLLSGFAVLAVDARGQTGETGSLLPLQDGWVKGWVTQGVTDIGISYYRAIALDAARAVDAAAAQPEVDAARIATAGGSQGGGLSLLAAALSAKVKALVADIPNMCHMEHGMLHSTGSLTELAAYVKRYPDRLETVRRTIAHVDMLNLAGRITAPVMMSVGWKDTVCLPETVYAVYNRISSFKQMMDYPFSGHEVGEYQQRMGREFLSRQLGLID